MLLSESHEGNHFGVEPLISSFHTLVMKSNKLLLSWDKFEMNASKIFCQLYSDQEFTDVTLATLDNKQIRAHKVTAESRNGWPGQLRILDCISWSFHFFYFTVSKSSNYISYLATLMLAI